MLSVKTEHYIDGEGFALICLDISYRDWCEFQNTELYHSLLKYSEELEKSNSQRMKQEEKD